jgi:hypothetical protein
MSIQTNLNSALTLNQYVHSSNNAAPNHPVTWRFPEPTFWNPVPPTQDELIKSVAGFYGKYVAGVHSYYNRTAGGNFPPPSESEFNPHYLQNLGNIAGHPLGLITVGFHGDYLHAGPTEEFQGDRSSGFTVGVAPNGYTLTGSGAPMGTGSPHIRSIMNFMDLAPNTLSYGSKLYESPTSKHLLAAPTADYPHILGNVLPPAVPSPPSPPPYQRPVYIPPPEPPAPRVPTPPPPHFLPPAPSYTAHPFSAAADIPPPATKPYARPAAGPVPTYVPPQVIFPPLTFQSPTVATPYGRPVQPTTYLAPQSVTLPPLTTVTSQIDDNCDQIRLLGQTLFSPLRHAPPGNYFPLVVKLPHKTLPGDWPQNYAIGHGPKAMYVQPGGDWANPKSSGFKIPFEGTPTYNDAPTHLIPGSQLSNAHKVSEAAAARLRELYGLPPA